MALFDPTQNNNLSGLNNVPGQSLGSTNTPAQIASAQGNNSQQQPPPQVPGASPTGLDDTSFLGVLNNLNTGFQQNNSLVDQKNLIQKQMFDAPLTPEELAKLPPDVRSIVQGGNRDQMGLQLQIINDSLQGRNNSIASSIGFLTTGYEQAQTRYNQDVTNVLNYAKALNAKPSDVMKALYPSEAARLGTQLDSLAAPLLTSTQVAPTTGLVSIPQTSRIAYTNNNPFNLKDSSGQFIKFGTAQEGWTAGVQDVTSKMTGGSTHTIPDGPNMGQPLTQDSTLEDMIRVYAPTADGNDPVSYARDIANQLGVLPTTKLNQLDPSQIAPLIAQHESGSTLSSNLTVSATPPDPKTSNTVNPSTGRTPSAIWQDSISFSLKGGNLQQFVGGLSSAGQSNTTKNLIDNTSAAMVDAAGVDRATLQQEYAANSKAINDQVDFMNTVQRALNGAELGATQTQTFFANKGINVHDSTWANKTLNDLTKQFGSSGDIRAYQAAMVEIGNEYAQVFARGGQRSVEGNRIAQDIIDGNVKLSDIQTSLDTLQMIGKTVIQTSVQQVQSIASGGGTDAVAKFLAIVHGVTPPISGGGPAGGANNDPMGLR